MDRSCPDPDSSISLASDVAQATNVGIAERIQAKQTEYDLLCHVREMSAQLALYLDELANRTEAIAEGVEVVAKVLSNWNTVFGFMGLAGEEMFKKPLSDNPGNQNLVGEEQTDYPSPMLVKIPTA